MALKKQHDVNRTLEIRYKVNQTKDDDGAEAGAGLVYATSASGDGVSTLGFAEVAAAQSGKKPIGMLMHDMEKVDTTKYRPNQWDMSQPKGNPAVIMKKGWAVTNKLFGTPAVGDPCYLHGTGIHTNAQGVGGIVDTPWVGEFETIKDENGYAKIHYNLPAKQR